MHYQAAPHHEVKLVRCVRGRIRDVVVDLRPESPHYSARRVTSSPPTISSLYIPEGCAHGLLTRGRRHVLYQISAEHVPGAARGVR